MASQTINRKDKNKSIDRFISAMIKLFHIVTVFAEYWVCNGFVFMRIVISLVYRIHSFQKNKTKTKQKSEKADISSTIRPILDCSQSKRSLILSRVNNQNKSADRKLACVIEFLSSSLLEV